MLLENKVSIITGAAYGIGAGIAELFARQGSQVHLLDIDLDKAEETAATIRATGGEAWAHKADVSIKAELAAAVENVYARHSRVDVLINNAGIYPRRLFFDMTESEWDQMMDVNLKSLFHLTKLVLPRIDRKSTRLNSSHSAKSRMPSSA